MNKRTGLFLFIVACIALILFWLYTVPRAFGQTFDVQRDSTYHLEWAHECPDSVFFNVYTQTLSGITITTATDTISSTFIATDTTDHWVTAQWLYGYIESNPSNVVSIKILGETPSPPPIVEIVWPYNIKAYPIYRMLDGWASQLVQINGEMYLSEGSYISKEFELSGGTYWLFLSIIGSVQVNFGYESFTMTNYDPNKSASKLITLPAGKQLLKIIGVDLSTHFTHKAISVDDYYTVVLDKVVSEKKPPAPSVLRVVQ